ncbi:MAG: H-type lectin domain-containing protein, partial [Ignavibacterium sp.]|uniref:H-type lectin domain-containing protein n=1 Tax=Ignavibacterium sp. TaxID=2651167 RepID=UPI00404A7B81
GEIKMKKLIAVLTLFVALTAMVSAQSRVQSGTWSVNPSVAGYNMDKNTGERTVTINVEFPKPFDTKPTVFLSVTQLDADKDTNARYNVEAMSVSRDGFTIKVKTWADSKIYSISGYWLAHAEK